jgi:hypothetical protein
MQVAVVTVNLYNDYQFVNFGEYNSFIMKI